MGASPTSPDVAMQLSVNAQGRLSTAEEFSDIVLKTSADGGVTRLGDVARIELVASEYSLRSLLDNKPAIGMGIKIGRAHVRTPVTNAPLAYRTLLKQKKLNSV